MSVHTKIEQLSLSDLLRLKSLFKSDYLPKAFRRYYLDKINTELSESNFRAVQAQMSKQVYDYYQMCYKQLKKQIKLRSKANA